MFWSLASLHYCLEYCYNETKKAYRDDKLFCLLLLVDSFHVLEIHFCDGAKDLLTVFQVYDLGNGVGRSTGTLGKGNLDRFAQFVHNHQEFVSGDDGCDSDCFMHRLRLGMKLNVLKRFFIFQIVEVVVW